MGDRDIPSVPVTTLAGLTSLSDLLSELPVSDSLSNATSLNKSLLFHTLVANESNNLLSVRDDNLVRQLVHAIEQTNSDNIELKPQYAIPQHLTTNISAYPELLQGIYNFRPTVFNTPQRMQNHHQQMQQHSPIYQQRGPNAINVIQQNVTVDPHLHPQQQLHLQPTQLKSPGSNNALQQHQLSSPNAKQQQVIISPNALINQQAVQQQQPQQQSLQQTLQNHSLTNSTHQQQVNVETPVKRTRRNAAAAASSATVAAAGTAVASAAAVASSTTMTSVKTEPNSPNQLRAQHFHSTQLAPATAAATSPNQQLWQTQNAHLQQQSSEMSYQVQKLQQQQHQQPQLLQQSSVIQNQQQAQQHATVMNQQHQQTVILPTPAAAITHFQGQQSVITNQQQQQQKLHEQQQQHKLQQQQQMQQQLQQNQLQQQQVQQQQLQQQQLQKLQQQQQQQQLHQQQLQQQHLQQQQLQQQQLQPPHLQQKQLQQQQQHQQKEKQHPQEQQLQQPKLQQDQQLRQHQQIQQQMQQQQPLQQQQQQLQQHHQQQQLQQQQQQQQLPHQQLQKQQSPQQQLQQQQVQQQPPQHQQQQPPQQHQQQQQQQVQQQQQWQQQQLQQVQQAQQQHVLQYQQHHRLQQPNQQQQQQQHHLLQQQQSQTKTSTSPQQGQTQLQSRQTQQQQQQAQQQSPQQLQSPQQQLSPQQQQSPQHQQSPQTQSIQGNFQNVLMLQRQQLQEMAARQKQLQQQQADKSTPRNNEYLLNQQPNKNSSNQSPAQAAVAPSVAAATMLSNNVTATITSATTTADTLVAVSYEQPKMATTTIPAMNAQQQNFGSQRAAGGAASEAKGSSSASPSSGEKSQVRVCINRLKAEDARLMQQSIKEFVQKSPETAIRIGLPVPEGLTAALGNDASAKASQIAVASVNATTSTPIADTFSLMKADEKRAAAKRRMAAVPADEIPPEQIYSKPKVRRVERIVAAPTPKTSKEEVMRTQTYQQFMRNMEQIIEQLDDTETPNFDLDGVDENMECISSKMLHMMSTDVAKLKARMALDTIPKNKLTLLINYAMRNVYLAKNYSAGPDDEDEIVDEDTMEKILNAMEACLLICNIYSTTKDLKFLQEDNISLIIKFVQFQFRETIFPSYDPVYTVKSMKKSDSRKKSKAHQNHNRSLQMLYSKAVELMKVFVTLFDKCIFVDTIVLPLSTVAVEPFFVDNIETLQFVCLELVTTIFRKERYDKIRSSILGDVLSSIDRLPSAKKNLRPFKLTNNGGNIQMVTALVLQLIQCATILPESLSDDDPSKSKVSTQQLIDFDDEIPGGATRISSKQNTDVVVMKKYDVAISIGGNFLTTFLNKCKTRSNETDFRPLFENFINDLLATVNKPEWPASELLLSLLGTMLVRYVSDKTIEQSIRLVSLDYLGIVAARLRKDTVESRCKVNIIDSMIKSIKSEQEKEGDLPVTNSKIELDPEEERTEFLHKILLDFLAVNAQEEDLIWDYARNFYLTQWYRDIIYQRRRIADGGKGYASRKKSTARKKRRKGGDASSASSGSGSSDGSDNDDNNASKNSSRTPVTDQELNREIFNVLEKRKRYLLSKIKPYAAVSEMNHVSSQHIKTYIDYNNAHLIAQYLASKRPFSQSFDGYLKKIILVVNEPSIAVRTRAMKCLANIVEVDPLVLKRKDMQMGVNQKFLDAAISVREAAVDLVGKFVLSNEELIDQYYNMLSTRILDTGVSVRKRVIKILRDICLEYPDFEKIPEICVKMIRRVNDEEGIQKLVTEVFMKMWFTPCKDNDKHGIYRKINQIIDVVNTAHDTGTTWLEGLLNSIFQPKENMIKPDGSAQEPVKKNTEPPHEIVLACQQLADGLVERLIELEDTDNARMLGCITTLHLLAKVRPQLLVRHAITIEPYLNIKCHSATAPKFICAVADILEQVVPLVVNPSESFLASLEEHLMLLVVSLNQAVVSSCVSCLGALVNKITKNYKLIRDCFQKFYRILDYSRIQVVQNNHSIDSIYTPMFRRSLFTIGILMRYFDFKSKQVIGDANPLPATIRDDAFECLMFFTQCTNYDIRKQSLVALGSFCVMNDDYLTRDELKTFYCDLLRSDTIEPCIKILCMRNIWIYLTESEMYMHNKEKEWEKQSKTDDLKEMNDVSSGMASRIIQLYLQEILDCFLNRDDAVRLWAVKVVQIVLRQGLVHPVRMVPYLICLSTDAKQETAHRSDALLKDIDKTYAGFVNMKIQFGLQLCFKLQEMLQCNNKGKNSNVVRGYIKRETDITPSALNDFLYTLLRTTRPQRRALVQTVTKQFDDQKTTLRQMLYIADNLAYFPYVVQDEPLYLIHQIDLLISMAGTNLLATFKECLKPCEATRDVLEDDDDEEDPEVLLTRLPDDTTEVQKCITAAQACMLLLILKQHLKDMYGLTDGKISRYSPSEMQKVYEKAVTRKVVPDFSPTTIIEVIRRQQEQKALNTEEENKKTLSDEEKRDLIVKYLDFKQLMLKLDPDDADSDEETRGDKSKLNNTTIDTTPTTSALNSSSAKQTPDDSLGSGVDNSPGVLFVAGGVSTPNLHRNASNNRAMLPPLSTKETPATPTSRASRQTTNIKSTSRKQPQRSKRKKRKIVSSDEEEDDYSDEDYV